MPPTFALFLDSEDIPETRSGHRIVVTCGALYSIGGYNPNYWEYDNTDGTIYPLFQEVCTQPVFLLYRIILYNVCCNRLVGRREMEIPKNFSFFGWYL